MDILKIQHPFNPVRVARKTMGWTIFVMGAAALIERAIIGFA